MNTTINKINVYRIETLEGKGICGVTGGTLCSTYRKASCERDLSKGLMACLLSGLKAEHEHCRFATISDETKATKLAPNPNMLYAFPSIEALHDWFPNENGRKAMSKTGAKGIIYSVPSVEIASKYQVIFDKSKAVKTGEFPL